MSHRIGIIYLSYHSDPHLEDAVRSWEMLTYDHNAIEIIIVDNPHPEYGSSMRAFESIVLPKSGLTLPCLTILPQKENIGFAGGNNAGIAKALELGCDYVFLHNDDGMMSAGCLEPLVAAFESDPNIGAAQPIILLYPDTEFVNTSGNIFHYLGFGFCGDYRSRARDLALPPVREISYGSGAALLLSAKFLRTYGLLDEDFFMYHEDLAYCFRLRMAGYKIVCVRDAIFFHKYQFGRSIQKFFWMERNRFGVLLMFFRVPTLLLLFPMLLLMECGQWLFALKNGWWKERLRLYAYWMNSEHWRSWIVKRKTIQAMRTIRDRELFRNASPTIRFQEKAMDHFLLRYVGNPLMALYYWIIVRGLIWW